MSDPPSLETERPQADGKEEEEDVKDAGDQGQVNDEKPSAPVLLFPTEKKGGGMGDDFVKRYELMKRKRDEDDGATKRAKEASAATVKETACAAEDSDEDEEEEEDDEEEKEQKKQEEYSAWVEDIVQVMYAFANSTKVSESLMDVAWLPQYPEEPSTMRVYAGNVGGNVHKLLLGTSNPHGANHIFVAETVIPYTFSPSLQGGDPRRSKGNGPSGCEITVVRRQIPHPTTVVKLAYSPLKPNLFTAKCTTGPILLHDLKTDSETPAARLVGHDGAGFGLEWSPYKEGLMASAGNDKTVMLWDCEGNLLMKNKQPGVAEIAPLAVMHGHDDCVGAVSWNRGDPTLLASTGDDCKLCIWDTRALSAPSATATVSPNYKNSIEGNPSFGVNCVSFHLNADPSETLAGNLLATGDTHGKVELRDMRKIESPLLTVQAGAEITCMKWMSGGVSSEDGSRFMVGLADGRLEVYDLRYAHTSLSDGGNGDA
eukprot:gene8364-12900_t